MSVLSQVIPIVAVTAGVLIAAVTDVWKFKVYNVLTFPLLVSGMLFHAWTAGWPGLGFSMSGAACGLGILLTFYVLGGLGAGDVKLLGGIGAWLGVHLTLQVLLIAGLAVGIYSLVLLALRGGVKNALTHVAIAAYQAKNLTLHLRSSERVEEVVLAKDRRRRLIPFALMVAMAVIAVLVQHRFAIDWLVAHTLK
jgi:prepilin peptidase CpaA